MLEGVWNQSSRSMYREEITSVTDAMGRTGKAWAWAEQKPRTGGMERGRPFYRAIHHPSPSNKLF